MLPHVAGGRCLSSHLVLDVQSLRRAASCGGLRGVAGRSYAWTSAKSGLYGNDPQNAANPDPSGLFHSSLVRKGSALLKEQGLSLVHLELSGPVHRCRKAFVRCLEGD